MGRNEWTALGLLAAAFLGGAALAGPNGQFAWFVARTSGLAAFAALTLSMILGLLVTTKASEPRVPRIFNFEIHSFVSVLALTLIGVHGGALLFDASFHFGPLTLLVPFIAPYAPVWTGLGVIAAWLVAIVTASFWAKKRIGHQTWRKLHYLSFAAYLLSLVHGISAGTDTSNALVFGFYTLSAASVAALFVLRLRGAGRPAAGRPAAKGTTAAATLGGAVRSSAMQPAPRPAPAVGTPPALPGSARRAAPPSAAKPAAGRSAQSRNTPRRMQGKATEHLLQATLGCVAGLGILGAVALSGHDVGSTLKDLGSSISEGLAPQRSSRAS